MAKQFGIFALLIVVAVALFAPSLPTNVEAVQSEEEPTVAATDTLAPEPEYVPEMIEQPRFDVDPQDAMPSYARPRRREETRQVQGEVVPTDRPVPLELR